MLYALSSFDSEGNPTDRQNDLMGSLGKLLVQAARYVTEATSGRVRGDNTHSNFICYQDEMTRWGVENVQKSIYFWASSVNYFLSIREVA
jgi:hypothetical protein